MISRYLITRFKVFLFTRLEALNSLVPIQQVWEFRDLSTKVVCTVPGEKEWKRIKRYQVLIYTLSLLNRYNLWRYFSTYKTGIFLEHTIKRMSVWLQINRKMVNTIWFMSDSIRFRNDFSVCTSRLKKLQRLYRTAFRETCVSWHPRGQI